MNITLFETTCIAQNSAYFTRPVVQSLHFIMSFDCFINFYKEACNFFQLLKGILFLVHYVFEECQNYFYHFMFPSISSTDHCHI